MNKKEARSYFQNKRSKLSGEKIENLSLNIFNQWKNSILSNFDSFHIFLSIAEKKEVNTQVFLSYLWNNNKKVYCSKVKGKELIHYELKPQTILKKKLWNIPEPINQKSVDLKTIDCVFIPLLAYDITGNRVGYGKGYYDSFLKLFPFTKKIGLSFFGPIKCIEDIHTSDVTLDYIITPDYYSGFPLMDEK